MDDDGGREASDRARGDAPRAGEPKTTTTTGRRARGAIDDGKITECEWEKPRKLSRRDATRDRTIARVARARDRREGGIDARSNDRRRRGRTYRRVRACLRECDAASDRSRTTTRSDASTVLYNRKTQTRECQTKLSFLGFLCVPLRSLSAPAAAEPGFSAEL